MVLLAAFLLLAHPPAQWTVVWPASAMGVRNARCCAGWDIIACARRS